MYKSFFLLLIIHSLSKALSHPCTPKASFAPHLYKRSTPSLSKRERDIGRRFFKYKSRPDIDAPRWDINVRDSEAVAPGYWFIAPYEDLGQKERGEGWVGPHIYDGNGELVWSGSSTFNQWNTFDFGLASIGGQQMITLLFSHENAGLILDSSYQVHRSVPLGENKSVSDMHDFHIIEDGRRALVTTQILGTATEEASKLIGYDGNCLARYHGFKEFDLEDPDSKPVFIWNARDHIRLDESTYFEDSIDEMCAKGWDILHLNAIDKFPDGDYLLSSRHTDTIYKISHHDASIVWRLGGVKSDFDFLGNAVFSRQHHARVRSQNETHILISLFDNAVGTGPNEHETHDVSRALLLALDTNATDRPTAMVLQEYTHPRGTLTNSRGSFQTLPNGNAFVCWTYSSHISEHLPDGTVILEAALSVMAHTYRAFKYPWVGRPLRPPDVHSEAIITNNGTNTTVWVSWNGATEIAAWNLFISGTKKGDLEFVASVPRSGFETILTHDEYASYIVVEAVNAVGETLGKSDVVHTLPPPAEMFARPALKAWDVETEPISVKPPMPEESVFSDHVPDSEDIIVEDGTDGLESTTIPDSQWQYDDQSSNMNRDSVLISPAVVFSGGFLCCGILGTLLWVFRFRSWRRRASYWKDKVDDYCPLPDGYSTSTSSP